MSNASETPRNVRSSRTRDHPLFELQYHSGDIKRGVKYIFLAKKHVYWGGSILIFWLALLVVGGIVAPAAVSNAVAARRYQSRVELRTALGVRMQELVRGLSELEQRSEATRTEMTKIYVAYGFDHGRSIGQGGYPTAPEPVPESIYASSITLGNGLLARIDEQLKVLDVFMREVQAFEHAHQEQVLSTPSISPLRDTDFVLTSPFGNRRSPFTKEIDFHNGIDLAATAGTPIHAPADGVVTFAGRVPARTNISFWRYGNLVALRHGDRFVTLFAHCREVRVKAKQRVKQGDVLATVGNTGWSTSPHLHYEVRRFDPVSKREIPRDPRIYILDHRWRDEEQILIRARSAPDLRAYEPLPRIILR